MEQAETHNLIVSVMFTRADIVRAQAVDDWVAKHLSHSVGDLVFSWLGELPQPYIEHIQALGLAFVGYRSPYRQWFEAPNRKRGDVPPAHLSDLIGEFEFSSEEAADNSALPFVATPSPGRTYGRRSPSRRRYSKRRPTRSLSKEHKGRYLRERRSRWGVLLHTKYWRESKRGWLPHPRRRMTAGA